MQEKSKRNPNGDDNAYCFDPFALRPADRSLLRDGVVAPLPSKVFDLLLMLVEHAGSLVRRERIMQALWPETYVEDANLTNSIAVLRRVLGANAIQTIPKHGYRFVLPIEHRPGVDPEVYERFLTACKLVPDRTPESLRRARKLYFTCLADDPSFAAAWAWLGRCCRFLYKNGAGDEEDMLLAEKAFERALSLDSELACAHQFYTLLQADFGQAEQAMVRLLERVRTHAQDAESFAGLVQVCRFCGLLEESVRAHRRAGNIDPAVVTSVPHTYFLMCDYAAVVETYGGPIRGYLDLAAWAALGAEQRAIRMGKERLEPGHLAPLLGELVRSLVAVLEGDAATVIAISETAAVAHDPETALYFARHLARLGLFERADHFFRKCVEGGLYCGYALENDPWLAGWRESRNDTSLLEEVRARTRQSRRAFREAHGELLLDVSPVRSATTQMDAQPPSAASFNPRHG